MLNRLLRIERQARDRPNDHRVICELAEARLDAGDARGAEQVLERAETLATAAGTGLSTVARLFERLNRADRAVGLYRLATRRADEATEAHTGLGRLALAQGDHSAAIVALSTAVWTAPTHTELRLMLARALLGGGRPEDALSEVLYVLARNPHNVDAWKLRVLLAERLSSGEERLTALRGAVGVLPSDLDLLHRLVVALDEAGQASEGTVLLMEAAHRHPTLMAELPQRPFNLGDAATRAGLEKLARLTDCPADLLVLAGRAEQLAERHTTAVVHFQAATTRGVRSPDLCCSLAWSLHMLGDFSGALSTLTQGLTAYRGDTQISALLNRLQGSSPPQAVIEASGEQSRMMVGSLDCIAVVDFLEFLRLNRRTGTMRLTTHSGMAEIHLIEGNLASISSSNVPRLGDHLIARGLVSRAQVDRLALEQDGLLLGRRLVEQKLISLEGLKNALYEQATTAITEVFGWNDGQFVFKPDDTLRQKIPPEFELNTAQVMLDALRWMDEQTIS